MLYQRLVMRCTLSIIHMLKFSFSLFILIVVVTVCCNQATSHEFHANLQFRHVLFHKKTNFLTLAGSGILPNMIRAVNRLHSLYWSIHTKDESKRETAFAFIFGVN